MQSKDDILKQRSNLSAAKRELLEKRLRRDKTAAPQVQMIARRSEQDAAPLSFAQQRLWFLDQLEPGSAGYNLPGALRLCGPLDVAALERSLNAIVARHEALRTSFGYKSSGDDDEPVQIIAPTLHMALPVIDLSTVPQATREAVVLDHALREAQQPFDLATGPLLRTAVLRLTPEEHVLLVTFHHSIADGWSQGIFIQELTTCYAAFVAGQTPTLPALPIQYADYAVWQRQTLQGAVLDAQVQYWRSRLADAPPLLDLPTDHPRPPIQSFSGALHTFNISRQVADGVMAVGAQEDATLFMTLLAAWQALLARYSGQDDIVVGTPIAGRTRAETEGVIGMFVNTLVLRSNLRGQPSFRELVARVREVCLGAYAHQDLPFEQVVEALQPARSLSYAPLFQVLFALQNAPMPPFALAGLTLSEVPIESGTAKFDLSLSFQEQADGLAGMIEYNTDLFEPATIERMAGHFQALLAAVVADPALPLPKVALLTPAEREQILIEWNATEQVYGTELCLHRLIETQVDRSPDAVAVVYDDDCLTYNELNRRANQLAHFLRTQGVGAEVLVGIAVERSVELVIGLLGILKAGGAYVPLDPSYPQERLAYMLGDARVPILLTQMHLLPGLPPVEAKVVCLDSDWSTIAQHSMANPSGVDNLDQLAYMIYTSGSTGEPKGALNTHRAICNRLLWMQDQYRLDEQDRVLQKTPFSFDVSVWEFFWPLLTGAQLMVARPDGHKDPAYLLDLIVRTEITTLHFVPSMLQIFLEQADVERCTSLRRVICSGEALSYDLQQRFFARSTAELHNLYGPTEAAVDVTAWACERDSKRQVVPIGRPVANTRMYILDRQLQPVPIGVTGDLYIGGVQVGRGYFNRFTLTAEKFIPDPFVGSADGQRKHVTAISSSARLYRTGDLARYWADGTIEYLGRSDHQVKLRGFRIELGEIEHRLHQHPQVQAVAVILREVTPGDQRLVAYVVGKEQESQAEPNSEGLSVSELRSYLAQSLPEYMVPSAFVVLEQLPVTSNGKLDRRALPDPGGARPDLTPPFVAPRTATEEVLAGIWAEVLGLEKIGIHDNFFELGGHSLLATQVVSRTSSVFQVQLPLRQIFEQPNVAGLAALILQHADNQTRIEKTAQLWLRLAALSEDEVETRLAEKDFSSISREGQGE
jgi:amino acid adenylation domain-containing protein